MNGDGKLDMVVTNDDPAGMGITVALGVGDGTFLAPNVVPYVTTLQTLITLSPYPSYLSLTDLDGDGTWTWCTPMRGLARSASCTAWATERSSIRWNIR